jgi:2-C-methyl-D-erythritol 4-phosphate cytidylyltransferase
MIWGAVIVAAGRGTRFGRPKQLVELGGKPLVAWSVEALAAMPEIVELVVVTEPEIIDVMEATVAAVAGSVRPRVVPGGPLRQDSVRLGLAALSANCAGILVHDGARPLVRRHEIRAGMRAVRPGCAALLATPVIDTIKAVDADGKVVRTFDRATLWAAQTPQFAAARDLRRVHDEAVRHGWPAVTDDAALLERGGVDVVVVEASADNFKVTLPGDLARAEAIVRERGVLAHDESEVLLVECFVHSDATDAVVGELTGLGARLDGIERDLPAAVVIRAYAEREKLRGFGGKLHAIAGEDALFTTHLSHRAANV